MWYVMPVVWIQYLDLCAGGEDLSQKSEILFSSGQQSGDSGQAAAATDHAGLDSPVSYDKSCRRRGWLLVSPAHSNDSSDSAGKYFTNIPRENILAQIWEKIFLCAAQMLVNLQDLGCKKACKCMGKYHLVSLIRSKLCCVEIAVIKLQCSESRQPWSNYLLIVLNKIFFNGPGTWL